MAAANAEEQVEAELRRLAPVDLAAELVRIPSHPGIDRQEESVVEALSRFFVERELGVEVEEILPGRPNLLVSIQGVRPGPHLLLCGHTDTVPPNSGDPGVGLSGEVRDGRLHGRGSVDMKGAVAAMATAMVALARHLPAGRVSFAAVIDEEMESLGAEKLVGSGFRADGAVVGEPTSNLIALGHKGLEWLEVHFRGKSAHGGTPDQGVNAVSAAGVFLALVEHELKPRLLERRHPILGPPTLNFGTIRGGDQPSTVAASCLLTLDRRTVPGESLESITAELADLLQRVERGFPGLETLVRRVPGGMGNLVHGALVTPPEAPLAIAAQAARREVCGEVGELTTFPAWTDGALLSDYARIPTLILGPGELSLAHSPREWVAVSEITDAARIYARLALVFCAGAEM
jgi:acetylornithine deacetylase/succinyl-diaminopimelate desuccinylase-like protein